MSLDIILDRGERPNAQLSPRTKIMSKLVATRKFCPIKKSYVFFTAAVSISLIPESKFRNLLSWVGAMVGAAVVGAAVGCSDGFAVGSSVGCSEGASVGCSVGWSEGSSVGSLVGCSLGSWVGSSVGRKQCFFLLLTTGKKNTPQKFRRFAAILTKNQLKHYLFALKY